MVDIVGGPVRCKEIVAFQAVLRKTGLGMVGVGGLLKIIEVATAAVVAQAVEAQGSFTGMALVATHGYMHTSERETIILVQFGNIVNNPVIGGVAT